MVDCHERIQINDLFLQRAQQVVRMRALIVTVHDISERIGLVHKQETVVRTWMCKKMVAHITHNNVVIPSKRRHFDVTTSKWRRFDIITTSLLRNVFTWRPCLQEYGNDIVKLQSGNVSCFYLSLELQLKSSESFSNHTPVRTWSEWPDKSLNTLSLTAADIPRTARRTIYKQRVLMHGHQGWNIRHGLCHIYMRYVYIYVSCL